MAVKKYSGYVRRLNFLPLPNTAFTISRLPPGANNSFMVLNPPYLPVFFFSGTYNLIVEDASYKLNIMVLLANTNFRTYKIMYLNSYCQENCKESWSGEPEFGYPRRRFTFLAGH